MNDPSLDFPPPAPPSGQPWQQGPWQAPDRTPPTVQAAAIVTYICCGLMVGLTLAFALLALMVGGFIAEYLDRADAAGLALMLAGSVIASLAMSVAACWFAWKSTQRKAWARIALAVCAGVALAFAILAAGPHSLVAVPGSTAVLVLLFLPPSNDWFRTTG